MALMHRGNRYVEVPDSSVSYYLNKGYNVEDENGNVLQASLPTDKNALQKMVKDLQKEVEDLKAELKKAEASLKKAKKDATKKEENKAE